MTVAINTQRSQPIIDKTKHSYNQEHKKTTTTNITIRLVASLITCRSRYVTATVNAYS